MHHDQTRQHVDPNEKFNLIFHQSELLYKTLPILSQKKGFGAKLIGTVGVELKDVTGKDVVFDELSLIFDGVTPTARDTYKQELNIPTEDKYSSNNEGYCIRTGVPIRFDIEKPFSYDAYWEWNQWGNIDYPENYCHFSGEESNGETSMEFPVLRRNWNKAQRKYNL